MERSRSLTTRPACPILSINPLLLSYLDVRRALIVGNHIDDDWPLGGKRFRQARFKLRRVFHSHAHAPHALGNFGEVHRLKIRRLEAPLVPRFLSPFHPPVG